MATSATEPTWAVTCWSTTSARGASVRSVHSPLPAKNRKWPPLVVGHLGGELTGAVEQAHVGVPDRDPVTGGVHAEHLALDDGLLGDVDAVERQTALDRAAHQASPASSPRATGTPTSEPYSVQEPS